MSIIALSGRQGSGKTTLSKALGYPTIKFADPLYEMHDQIKDVLERYGYRQDRAKKYGPLLQYLGTEFGREQIGVDIWTSILARRLAALPFVNVCVDDMRFPNEFDMLKSRGALMVRLEASEAVRKLRAEKWRPQVDHPSEVGLDGYKFDLVLNTDEMSVQECVSSIKSAEGQHGRKEHYGEGGRRCT